MTVKQLIEILEQCNPEASVCEYIIIGGSTTRIAGDEFQTVHEGVDEFGPYVVLKK